MVQRCMVVAVLGGLLTLAGCADYSGLGRAAADAVVHSPEFALNIGAATLHSDCPDANIWTVFPEASTAGGESMVRAVRIAEGGKAEIVWPKTRGDGEPLAQALERCGAISRVVPARSAVQTLDRAGWTVDILLLVPVAQPPVEPTWSDVVGGLPATWHVEEGRIVATAKPLPSRVER